MKLTSCQICGRQLTDNESIARGFGPDCAARRASFLASVGTSETELTALESTCEPAACWIRNFRQDMRAGRVRQARQCIDAARRKAGEVVQVVAVSPAAAPVVIATPARSPPSHHSPQSWFARLIVASASIRHIVTRNSSPRSNAR